MRRSRAGGRGGRIRSLRPVTNRDVSRGQIYDRRGNKERRYLSRPAVKILGVLALDDIESANSGTDIHAGGIGNLGSDLKTGHAYGKIGSSQSELNEPGHLFEFFFL